jgi:hypothetical protein
LVPTTKNSRVPIAVSEPLLMLPGSHDVSTSPAAGWYRPSEPKPPPSGVAVGAGMDETATDVVGVGVGVGVARDPVCGPSTPTARIEAATAATIATRT